MSVTGADDPRQAARSLRSLIEAEAVEEADTMTEPVVEALDQAGLFGLLVPTELGGLEADPVTIIDVCEELSYADGSVGWAFAQNTTVGAYLAYVDRDVAAGFADQRAGAGMFAPLGVARIEPGGFRISGSFGFGSGSGHATFVGGSALVMDGDEVGPFGDDGSPPVVGFLVPIEGVELHGNGLRGTGSYDFEVREQFVSDGATWRIFQPGKCDRVTGGAPYGLGQSWSAPSARPRGPSASPVERSTRSPTSP
ncbi:MAG: acyl-CoA dehydrogenase family protein [Acidimicrobiia bacterium]|nr:acyl-CoA dehydrogenase family protein [Acidimicrobiia bacterium]